MAQFFKGKAERGGIFEVEEQGTQFGFSGGGENGGDDGAMIVYGAIDRRGCIIRRRGNIGRGWCGAEEEMAAGAGAGKGLGEVGCIAMDPKMHVTGVKAEDGIRMRGAVVA